MSAPELSDRVYPATRIALIVDALRDRGVPIRLALDGTGLTGANLLSPSTRVSRGQTLQVVSNACKLVSDSNFAYSIGLKHHVSVFGIYGFAILSCKSYRQACQYAVQYHELTSPLMQISFRECGGRGIWTLSLRYDKISDPDLSRFIVEMYIGIGVALHRDVLGENYSPSEIELTFGPPNMPIDGDYLACRALKFGQQENRVIFDAAWLERPAELGNELTYNDLVEKSAALVDAFVTASGVAGRVRKILLLNISERFDQNSVCDRLCMTARTLRRMLRAEGTSFREIADDVRRQLAIKYLHETNLTVEDIAAATGFCDTANFRRALRRVTGMTPLQVRALARPMGEGVAVAVEAPGRVGRK